MYIRKRYDKGAESPPRKNEYETVSNHPILKTDWALRAHIPRFLQTRPDRKQEFCDQRFYIDRGNEAQQEFPCNVSGESGVNSVKMFAFRLCKNGILLYLLCIFSCYVHVVPSAPEFPISVFVFQFRKLLVSIRRLFPFRISMNLDTLSLAASPSACGCGLGTSPLRCS